MVVEYEELRCSSAVAPSTKRFRARVLTTYTAKRKIRGRAEAAPGNKNEQSCQIRRWPANSRLSGLGHPQPHRQSADGRRLARREQAVKSRSSVIDRAGSRTATSGYRAWIRKPDVSGRMPSYSWHRDSIRRKTTMATSACVHEAGVAVRRPGTKIVPHARSMLMHMAATGSRETTWACWRHDV